MVKYILTVMFFTTAPSNIPDAQLKDHDVFESNHVWSAQNTTSAEYSSLEGCWAASEQFIDSIFPVGTMTLRSWCQCDSDENKCPNEQQQDATLNKLYTDELKYLEQKWEAERAELANNKTLKKAALAQALHRFDLLRVARRALINDIIKQTEPKKSNANPRITFFSVNPPKGNKESLTNFKVQQLFPFPSH